MVECAEVSLEDMVATATHTLCTAAMAATETHTDMPHTEVMEELLSVPAVKSAAAAGGVDAAGAGPTRYVK